MDPLAISMIVSQDPTAGLAHSALPHAPVVEETAPATRRVRVALATGLERLATVVAPRDGCGRTPSRVAM
jgi:hypothetical protein